MSDDAPDPFPPYVRAGQRAAVDRARRYHLQRLAEIGEALAPEDEPRIIPSTCWYLPEVGDGWRHAGSVLDTHGGIAVPMLVYWHMASDRVRIERPPFLQPPPPPPVLPPMRFGWRKGLENVDPGMIYTLDGVDYTPEEAVLKMQENRRIEGWSWRKAD